MSSEDKFLQQEDSSLDRFRQRLERKGEFDLNLRSTRLPEMGYKVNTNWDNFDDTPPILEPKSSKWLINFFWGATIFFLATLAISFYVLFYSSNIVSANNINIDIKAPTQIRSGEELNLELTILNRNKVTLQDAVLSFSYPTGSMDSISSNQELLLRREKIGDVAPGEKKTVSSRALIFGAENDKPKVLIKLEYNIPDSNAVFSKELEYEVLIESSTLAISLDVPSDINLGKTFGSRLVIVSNAKSTLRQVGVRVEYPAGFSFQSASPEPRLGDDFWYLGDLAPGDKREIILTGSLSGLNEDLKTFKVMTGWDKSAGQGDIATVYSNLAKIISLKKDFVGLAIDLGGRSSVSPGGQIDGKIDWNNNLSDKVLNGRLELSFVGLSLDKRSVRASQGFYNSLTNSIVWDKQTLPKLGLLNPRDSGQVNFSFNVLGLNDLPAGEIEPLSLKATFVGTRQGDNNQETEIVSENSRSLRISSLARLNARALYNVGPFRNTGPLPPRVGEETTYTITLELANSTNELKSARLTADIPSYLRWLGNFSSLDERLIYSQTDSKVIWDIGTVAVTAIDGTLSRQLSFQVALTPSLSQVGLSPLLLRNISFSAVDALTGIPIKLQASDLNTNLSGDPSFVYTQSQVVE